MIGGQHSKQCRLAAILYQFESVVKNSPSPVSVVEDQDDDSDEYECECIDDSSDGDDFELDHAPSLDLPLSP